MVLEGGGTKVEEWKKGGGEGETGAKEHMAGGSREGESQEGGEVGRSSMVIPGRSDEGSLLRCSMKVTWKELKTFLVESSHNLYTFEFGAYPIRMQGLDCW